MRVFSFRNIRILVLLMLLGYASLYTYDQRLSTQGWYKPLAVVVYPINVAQSQTVDNYIRNLPTEHFTAIDDFIRREGKKYDIIAANPTVTRRGTEVKSLPPAAPQEAGILKAMLWSLKLRWWAYRNTPDEESNKRRIRIFVLYHDDNGNQPLDHSLGLQKGLLGIVHAYALSNQEQQNNIVIAHELLHTVGATDKYGSMGQPVHPHGYAMPLQQPLHPQRRAEIMAGRIATTATTARMPNSLRSVVVGDKTAREIGWITVDDNP